jgi:phospholipase/lecithinase/hemolysin
MRVRTAAVLVAITVLAFVAGSVSTAAKGPYGSIVVFGTSLSDAGNAFALLGLANTPPDYDLDLFLVPGAPYAKGGHHFSNGATWVEQLARPLGLAGSVRPAFGNSDPGATNFAVGGARARENGSSNTLPAQVDAFLRQFDGIAPSDGLYVIEMGSNDVRDAFGAFAAGGDGTAILTDANTSIASSIGRLYAAGARQFLVWRAPDVGLTPAIRLIDTFSPGAAGLATQVTQGFNSGLDFVVQQLSGLPGITIMRLDAFGLLTAVVAHPGLYGLTTVDAACVTPGTPPFACHRPDEFLFWDGIHPTGAGHAIVAQEAARVLTR